MSKFIYKHSSPNGLENSSDVSNSSVLIIKEAEKLGLAWEITAGTKVVTIKYKGEEKSYHYQIPSSTTALADYACTFKKTTSNLLQEAEVSIPKGYRVDDLEDEKYLKEVFNSLKKPLVVKPDNGEAGENITIKIDDYEKYIEAIKLAAKYSTHEDAGIIVQEMFFGEEYRVLVTREKVIGVLKRVPANVVGNGEDTIKELIAEKNLEEIRGEKIGLHSHRKIEPDKKMKQYLTDQGLTFEDVLKPEQQVFLRKVSNISQGGDAIDFTDLVHPSVKEISLAAIQAIPGLSFAGVDFMSSDITKKQTADSYVIVEVNSCPGFDIHDLPYKGKNRHAAREFLYLLFPNLKNDLLNNNV